MGLASETQSKDCGGDGIENLTHRSHNFPHRISMKKLQAQSQEMLGFGLTDEQVPAASLPLCHTHGAQSTISLTLSVITRVYVAGPVML